MTKLSLPLLVSILSLFGCSDETRVNVSEQEQFRRFVGMQFEIVGPVDAYGIRPHSKAEVEYVTLIPLPGIEGPEVGFRTRLQVGSKVTVQRAMKTNRMFDPSMSYEVLLEGTQLPNVAPVRLDLFRGNEGEGAMQLNPKLYRTLRSAS
jgi:hypothetical protein